MGSVQDFSFYLSENPIDKKNKFINPISRNMIIEEIKEVSNSFLIEGPPHKKNYKVLIADD